MTFRGATALARTIRDKSANPPIHCKVRRNGPNQVWVVHVTYGKPKPDKGGNTPPRPAPYTIGPRTRFA